MGGGIHGVSGPLKAPAKEIRDALFVFHYQESHNFSLAQVACGQDGILRADC
jgi:hypothetical protein